MRKKKSEELVMGIVSRLVCGDPRKHCELDVHDLFCLKEGLLATYCLTYLLCKIRGNR